MKRPRLIRFFAALLDWAMRKEKRPRSAYANWTPLPPYWMSCDAVSGARKSADPDDPMANARRRGEAMMGNILLHLGGDMMLARALAVLTKRGQ